MIHFKIRTVCGVLACCAIALLVSTKASADSSTTDAAAWIGIQPSSMVIAQFTQEQTATVLSAIHNSTALRNAILTEHANADTAAELVTVFDDALRANPDNVAAAASLESANSSLALARSRIQALREDLFNSATIAATAVQRDRLLAFRMAENRRVPAEFRIHARSEQEWTGIETALRAERRAIRKGELLDTTHSTVLLSVRSHPDVVAASAGLQSDLAAMKSLFQQFDS